MVSKTKPAVIRSLSELSSATKKSDLAAAVIKRGILPKGTSAKKPKPAAPAPIVGELVDMDEVGTAGVEILDFNAAMGDTLDQVAGTLSEQELANLQASGVVDENHMINDIAAMTAEQKALLNQVFEHHEGDAAMVLASDADEQAAAAVETPIDPEDDVVDESGVRAVLIDQLLEFDSGEHRAGLREAYARLTTDSLQEQLTLLQAEWGGSVKMKASLEAANALIKKAQTGQLAKARATLLGQKYKEYHLLAQKIEKALGADTVISGMKHTEYHKQLTSIIKTNASLSTAIREMANLLSFNTTDEVPDANLAPANVEELVRVCLAIGVSAKSWILAKGELSKRITQLENELARIIESRKATQEALNNAREASQQREAALLKQQHARFGQKFAIVNLDGQFLTMDEDAEAINPKVLDFADDMANALLMNNEEKVRRVYDALRRWSKAGSKYVKLVQRKGLHPAGLSVVRVTLTKI